MLTRRTFVTALTCLPAFPAAAQPQVGIQKGQTFPDITYKGPDGSQHSISETRGRVTLLYFWASWCPICQQDMRTIQAVYLKHHQNPRFQAILLNFLDPYERGLRWAESRGYRLPFSDSGIEGNQPIAMTAGGTYTLPRQTPLFFLLDASGTVIEATEHKTNDERNIHLKIEEALKTARS